MFNDFASICLERPSSIAEVEAYQSPGAAARRQKACAGMDAAANGFAVVGPLTPGPNVAAGSAYGIATG